MPMQSSTSRTGRLSHGGTTPRLSLRGIAKSFDTNVVLSGIDLDVYEGSSSPYWEKTGPANLRFHRSSRGLSALDRAMTWEGRPYAPGPPGEAIEAGIGLIHQEMRLLRTCRLPKMSLLAGS